MKKCALVTGATGFLGGWLIDRLLQDEFHVISLLKPQKESPTKIDSQYHLRQLGQRCTEISIDLNDFDSICDIMKKHRPDVLVPLAAVGDINISAKMPKLTFDASATSTLNLLEAVRLFSPDTLFLSHTTDKVYGQNAIPFHEEQRLDPLHIYEVAKVSQEFLTRSYAKNYGTKAVTIRCGNYFGGYDFNFNRIVPYTIRQALMEKKIILRSTGAFTRDFLYIEDGVLINQLFIRKHFESSLDSMYGEAFNFSLESELKIIDLVRRILDLMGTEAEIEIENRADCEIPNMLLSCCKAKRELDWRPTFSLDEGLQKTIGFYSAWRDGRAGSSDLGD